MTAFHKRISLQNLLSLFYLGTSDTFSMAGDSTPQAVKAVQAVFTEAQTSSTGPTAGASNAPLDLNALGSVLKSFLGSRKLQITTDYTSVNPSGTKVTYLLRPAAVTSGPLSDYYLVNVLVCSAAKKATEAMKECLLGFQRLGVVNNVDPKQARLGDYALRTRTTVLWVRGESVFVQISHKLDAAAGAKPSTASGAYLHTP